MTKIISVEEIGQCRSGPDNDIDLQAVFGGIKGRQPKGLKVNPLYDNNHGSNAVDSTTPDINGNINNVHVVTYKSIPECVNGDETPVVKTISDIELQKDQNGNENTDGKLNVQLLDEIKGKNGSIKRHDDFPHKVVWKPTRQNKMPEHLGEVGNGSLNVVPIEHIADDGNPNNGKRFEKENKVKDSSSYKLLGYNNDGYTEDEADHELESVDNDKAITENADLKPDDVVIVVKEDEEHNTIDHEIQNTANPDIRETKTEEIDENQQCKALVNGNNNEKFTETFIRTHSSYSSASEQSVKTEIITEAHVHTTEHNQNSIDSRAECSQLSDPDKHHRLTIKDNGTFTSDTRVISETDNAKLEAHQKHDSVTDESSVIIETVVVSENNEHASTIKSHENEDGEFTGNGNHVVDIKPQVVTMTESDENAISNENENNSSSTKTIKSILLTVNGKQITPPPSPKSERTETKDSFSEIQECKSVTFSDDTVFNENKSKRFKVDRIQKLNLRDIYRGKISSDTAMAKMNPLFTDDGDNTDGERSMSEDERIAYQIALKKVMKSTKGRGKDMNSPALRDHFLILKANGIKPANVNAADLPDDIEQPAYDRLIQRTIAKERRRLIVKWTLVIITVAIVTAVATVLGVHFKSSD